MAHGTPTNSSSTVIKAELDVLLFCASSPFKWTNKLEEQHMDGDQKLNIISPCLYQQGQGGAHPQPLCLQLDHLHYKLVMPTRAASRSCRCFLAVCSLLHLHQPPGSTGRVGSVAALCQRAGHFYQCFA